LDPVVAEVQAGASVLMITEPEDRFSVLVLFVLSEENVRDVQS
jgi:hypothetical protein